MVIQTDGSEVYIAKASIRDKEHPYAQWASGRRILLFGHNWPDVDKNPEHVAWIINHELLHSIIGDILIEDHIIKQAYSNDAHWPYYYGIDLMDGKDYVSECYYMIDTVLAHKIIEYENTLGEPRPLLRGQKYRKKSVWEKVLKKLAILWPRLYTKITY